MKLPTRTFQTYYQLTKPGIIYGNLMNATAGFLLACRWHIDWRLLAATLVGTALVIASACVLNNYIDRGIDKHMARTKKRALVTGIIPLQNAIIYAIILGSLGFLIMALYTNWLTVILGTLAVFVYVVLYGWAKRNSVHSTVVGSIAGALPLVAGYTAVTNHLDKGAWLLFFILVFWQMPHFYAIAIRRKSEYKAAGIPVLPLKRGVRHTKIQMLLYIVAFTIAASLLTVFGYTGYIYLAVVVLLGLTWLWFGLKGFASKDDTAWARKMFLFSLIVTLSLSIVLSVGPVLP